MSIEQQYEIKAGIETLNGFEVQGISIVTDNEKATEYINALWERFFKESIGTKINNKEDDNIYAVYSDYEGDHTKPYRYTIGYRLKQDSDTSDNTAPENMHTVRIETNEYAAVSAAGPQPQSLIETWTAVWESDMDRAYKTDFEFYGPRFFEDGINEVILYIGLKETK